MLDLVGNPEDRFSHDAALMKDDGNAFKDTKYENTVP